jgi:hypothetical protein
MRAGPAGRAAQAMTASSLMGRLPTFPAATVDEVLDIRTTLERPLVRFRGTMAKAVGSFQSEPWETDFDDEIHDYWISEVAPALADIEEAVRENRSLLALTDDFLRGAKAGLPGLSLMGAGVLEHDVALGTIGGTATALGPMLQVLRERRKTTTEINARPFYLLHPVETSAAKRSVSRLHAR